VARKPARPLPTAAILLHGALQAEEPLPLRPGGWVGLKVALDRARRDGFSAVPVVVREITPQELEQERLQ
jgi:hypothetical protein